MAAARSWRQRPAGTSAKSGKPGVETAARYLLGAIIVTFAPTTSDHFW
jgi:hypothetical protein